MPWMALMASSAVVRKQNWSNISRRQKSCKMSKHFSKAFILSVALVAQEEHMQKWNLRKFSRCPKWKDTHWTGLEIIEWVWDVFWWGTVDGQKNAVTDEPNSSTRFPAFVEKMPLYNVQICWSLQHVPCWFEEMTFEREASGSTHRSVQYFKTYSLGPLSSKMFWFQLSWHVWTMPSWGDWGWNIFVTLFMKLFKT